jgi:hypothetical protein
VPDYRKISPATHAELATTLYGFLMREGTIATDWFALQVEQANHTDGDIDTLSTASPTSAPGPLPPIVLIGSPIQSTGKA